MENVNLIWTDSWGGFFLLSATILIVLILIRKLITLIGSGTRLNRRMARLTPVLDTIGVLAIILLFGRTVVESFPTNQMIVIILVLVFVFWLLRNVFLDMVSGFVYRIEHTFDKGDVVTIDSVTGCVGRIGIRSFSVQLENGDQVSIPYSQLTRISLKKPLSGQHYKSKTIDLAIEKSESIQEAKIQLQRDVQTLPWTPANKLPLIEEQEGSERSFNYRVTITALDNSHLAQIERHLKDKYGSW